MSDLSGFHQGIILKIYLPDGQKIILLDAQLGKIECIVRNTGTTRRLTNGMHIIYILKKWGDNFKAEEIIIRDAPLYWARSSSRNFMFFCHVLEICYYFLSFNSAAPEIFMLVDILYKRPELMQTDITKKFFLCRMFIRLGIYPDNNLSYNSQFFDLISGPLDSKVNAGQEYIVDKWLLDCLYMHPKVHNFKTKDFLKKLETYEE